MRSVLISLVLRLMSRLSLRSAHRLGTAIGWLAYRVPNRERRNARINIDLCLPQEPQVARRALLRRTLMENARTLTESPVLWSRTAETWRTLLREHGLGEMLRSLLGSGKGLIVAAPHLGSWEAGLHALTRVAPVTALYRPPRETALEPIMTAGRARSGARLVPTSAKGIRSLYSALRRGELVAVLPDQQPKGGGRGAGVFAPFFGVPAYTMTLIGRLARRTGCPVVFVFTERLPRGRGYRMHWLNAPPGIDAADPVLAATALNQGVESCVRICPDQYQWTYKRFQARPPGQPRLYRGPL